MILQHRLAELPNEAVSDLATLFNCLERESGSAERLEIYETITEILLPETVGEIKYRRRRRGQA